MGGGRAWPVTAAEGSHGGKRAVYELSHSGLNETNVHWVHIAALSLSSPSAARQLCGAGLRSGGGALQQFCISQCLSHGRYFRSAHCFPLWKKDRDEGNFSIVCSGGVDDVNDLQGLRSVCCSDATWDERNHPGWRSAGGPTMRKI